MPPPPSYIDITSLPFVRTVTQAEFNGGTFGGVANQVWFRYVASVNIGLGNYTDSGGTFTPRVTLYESDGTTQINEFNTSYGWWAYLLADTYYIKVTRSAGGASNFDFTCTFNGADVITSPDIGDLMINDDTQVASSYPTRFVPATIWSIDGTFKGIAPNVPAGETGDALPNGQSLWQDRFGQHGSANSLAQIDADLSTGVTNINGFPVFGQFAIVANNGTNFYVLNRATDNKIYVYDSAGNFVSQPANLNIAWTISAIGVSNNGSILYYARGNNTAVIGRHDLTTNLPLSDLYTIPGFSVGSDYIALSSLNLNPGEILVLSDDTIVTWYLDASTGDSHLLHISAAGALINEYTFGPEQINHISYAPNDTSFIYVWFFTDAPLGNNGIFGRIELSTGTLSPSFNRTLFSGGENLNVSNEIFGPSASCTMVCLGYSGTPPPGTGNITIGKIVVPSTDITLFNYLAGGGLIPTTFALSHGGSHSYIGLTPGSGYSIEELTPPGWTVSVFVSNGSPISNLLVTEGETTFVVFTNTLASPTPPATGWGGIYQIVPGKRNDTIWTDVGLNETLDVKIPNPKARLAYVGE